MSKKIILSISLLYLGSLFVMSGCVGPSKAELKFSMKEYSAAIPLYEEYLSENPKDSESRSKLGFSYFKTGKLNKAIEIFNSVLKSKDNLIIENLTLKQQLVSSNTIFIVR